MSDKEIIRIGIIGAGFARMTQIPAFKACEGARITAITSAHREHAAKVAREFGIEHVANDWRELVKRDDVDLVSIVTPVVTHCEMTLAALEQGKAVLCEKPMAMNAEEALRMAERAREAGVLALIDHELRFLSGRIQMREMLRRGDIGQVRHARLTFSSDSRADPERPWNWWSDAAQGGGALGAIGSHVIDGFRWLLNSEMSQVFCNLATHISERTEEDGGPPRPVTSDDEANLVLKFADKDLTQETTGTASMSMVESGKPEHRLEIFGSRGALMMRAIPTSDIEQHHHAEQRCEREPRDARLPVRHHDEGGEQRTERSARVPADLEDRLRQTVLSARRHARDARGLGMKYG